MIAFAKDEIEYIQPPPMSKWPLVLSAGAVIVAIGCMFWPEQYWLVRVCQLAGSAYVLGYVQGIAYARKKWNTMARELQQHNRKEIGRLAKQTAVEMLELLK